MEKSSKATDDKGLDGRNSRLRYTEPFSSSIISFSNLRLIRRLYLSLDDACIRAKRLHASRHTFDPQRETLLARWLNLLSCHRCDSFPFPSSLFFLRPAFLCIRTSSRSWKRLRKPFSPRNRNLNSRPWSSESFPDRTYSFLRKSNASSELGILQASLVNVGHRGWRWDSERSVP